MIFINNEKVSVVVPIYKVEKYIHRCVDSILTQTYDNLEVILVNDGSPDSCGDIADAYQKNDSRIKVIHKENGGLSDARNVGIKSVTGTFTMFVDSDDWIDPTMIETMLRHAKAFSADVVQAGFYYAYEDKLLFDWRYLQEGSKPIILDNQTLMYELVRNEKVKNFAWGKLYKTTLIKDIPFKKGVIFEDVFWAHQVMHHVKTYIILNQPFYYYLQRDDSIVATYSPKNLDMIAGLKERHQFIETYYKELTSESYQIILKTCLIHYEILMRNKRLDSKYRKEIELYIKNHLGELKHAVQENKALKKKLSLFTTHPYFFIGYEGALKGLRKVRILPQRRELKQVNV